MRVPDAKHVRRWDARSEMSRGITKGGQRAVLRNRAVRTRRVLAATLVAAATLGVVTLAAAAPSKALLGGSTAPLAPVIQNVKQNLTPPAPPPRRKGAFEQLVDSLGGLLAEQQAAPPDDGPPVEEEAAPAVDLGPFVPVLKDLLCPPVTRVHALLASTPGAAEIAAAAELLVCNLEILNFQFHTVWQAPDGDLVKRTFNARLGIPRLLNVDATPGPDLVGTLGLGEGPGLSMSVRRMPGAVVGGQKPLPASVEAVIEDPTDGALPGDRLAFGYDELDNTVPRNFTGTVDLVTLIASLNDGGVPTLDLTVTQNSPAADTTLLFSNFDGTPSNRAIELAGRLDFQNSPTSLGAVITLDDPLQASITTDVTGPVHGQFQLGSGSARLDLGVLVVDLPSALELELSLTQPRISYRGFDAAGNPKGIDRLELELAAASPLVGRIRFVRVAMQGFPADAQVEMASGQLGFSSSGRIAQIEAFAGSDPERPGDVPAAGRAGLRLVDVDAEPFAIGARIFGLRTAEVDLGPIPLISPMSLLVESAGGPFDIYVKLASLELEAEIRDLPSLLGLGLDLLGGTITYEASEAIQSINAEVRSSLLPLGLNEVSLLLEQIPKLFAIEFDPSFRSFAFSSDNPIHKIEVLAKTPGATDERGLAPVGQHGVVLRQIGSDVYVFGRVFGLKEIAFGLDPLSLHTKLAPGLPLLADVVIDNPELLPYDLDLRAEIQDLPETIDLIADLAAGTISYSASQEIAAVDFSASSSQAFLTEPLEIARVEAALREIPAAFDLSIAGAITNATGFELALDNPIGLIEFEAASAGAAEARSALGASDGAVLRAAATSSYLFARVRGLKRIGVDQNPLALRTATASRRPFVLDAQISDPDLGLPFELDEARLEVNDLPTALELSADLAAGTVTYNAAEPIASVDADAETSAPFVAALGLNEVDARFEGVPTSFRVGLPVTGASSFGLLATGSPIELVEVSAKSATATAPPPASLPAAGVVVNSSDEGSGPVSFAFARVEGLAKLQAGLDPVSLQTVLAPGQRFELDADLDNPALLAFPLDAHASVTSLPETIDLIADLAAGTISYSASQEIAAVDFSASSSQAFLTEPLEIARVEAALREIPAAFDLSIAGAITNATGFELALDNPIGLIEFEAASAGAAEARSALGASDGAVLRAAATSSYLFARVRGLKRIGVDQNPLALRTATASRRPFVLDAQISDPDLGLPFELDEARLEVNDLPTALELSADLAAGTVTYNAVEPIACVTPRLRPRRPSSPRSASTRSTPALRACPPRSGSGCPAPAPRASACSPPARRSSWSRFPRKAPPPPRRRPSPCPTPVSSSTQATQGSEPKSLRLRPRRRARQARGRP